MIAFTDGEEGGSLLDSKTMVDVAGRVEAVTHVVLVEPRNDEARGRPPVWIATAADVGGLQRLSDVAARRRSRNPHPSGEKRACSNGAITRKGSSRSYVLDMGWASSEERAAY